MPVGMENTFTTRPIKTDREPVGPKNAASKGSIGDQALMDSLIIVVAAWAILFFIYFSVRGHNV